MENDKEMPLGMPEGKISCLRMEPATNGVIISYDLEKKKPSSKGTFDNSSYEYGKKEVFDFDPNDNEEFDKAFERYKALWKASYKG